MTVQIVAQGLSKPWASVTSGALNSSHLLRLPFSLLAPTGKLGMLRDIANGPLSKTRSGSTSMWTIGPAAELAAL